MEFFDIHCHMLAAVDDGAKTESEMFSMLNLAYEDGVRKICMTPHHEVETFGFCPDKIHAAFAAAEAYASRKLPGLSLYLGSEISCRIDNVEDLRSGRCFTLAGGRYVLVDFLDVPNAEQIRRALEQFCSAGYIPIVAHVERYRCFSGKLREIEYLAADGILFQINATSLLKDRRDPEKKNAEKILARGLADVVASDAHDTEKRPPVLSAAFHFVEEHYGGDSAELLFRENPGKILENKTIRS